MSDNFKLGVWTTFKGEIGGYAFMGDWQVNY